MFGAAARRGAALASTSSVLSACNRGSTIVCISQATLFTAAAAYDDFALALYHSSLLYYTVQVIHSDLLLLAIPQYGTTTAEAQAERTACR